MITTTANFNSANAAALQQKNPVVVMTISNYFRAFTSTSAVIAGLIAGGITTQSSWLYGGPDGKKLRIEGLSWKAQDLNGDSTLSDTTVSVVDMNQQLSVDRLTFTFEGQIATIYLGFTGLAFADFAKIATLRIEDVKLSESGQVYDFVLKDSTSRLLKSIIYAKGDNGLTTDKQNPKTLGPSNPMVILLDVLQNQLGLSAGQYNGSLITSLQNGLFAGLKFKMILTRAPEAHQFLQLELFKSLGGWYFQNFAGVFTPVYEIPQAAPVVQLSMNDRDFLDIPDYEEAPIVNQVSYRLNNDTEKGPLSEIPEGTQGNASTVKYGISAASSPIQARGMRAEFGGWLFGRLVINMLIQRYGFKAPIWTFKTRLNAIALELGDFIQLSSNFVPNRITGRLGITNILAEITDIKKDLSDGTVAITALDQTWLVNQFMFQCAPDGEANFPATSGADQARYLFVCSASTGKYSNGVNGNPIP